MRRLDRPARRRVLAAFGAVLAAALAAVSGVSAMEPVADRDRVGAPRSGPTVIIPQGARVSEGRPSAAAGPKASTAPDKAPRQPDERRDRPPRNDEAAAWIGPRQEARLVRLPAEFLSVPDLPAKIRPVAQNCRVAFGWQRPPQPIVVIVCSAPAADLRLKITGFAPLQIPRGTEAQEIRSDELISTRDLRLFRQGASPARPRVKAIGLDWYSMIKGSWEPQDPAESDVCTLDRPVTLVDLVEREGPMERGYACGTVEVTGPLPLGAKLEGCLDGDAVEARRCRIVPNAQGGARIRFGGLFGDMELRPGEASVDPGDRTPRDDLGAGGAPTFVLPGFGTVRYRSTSARYCSATACCPDPAPTEAGRPLLSRFSPNVARCGELAGTVDRLVVDADLEDAPEPLRPMLEARRSFVNLVDRPVSAGPSDVADLLPARAYATVIPEAGSVPRPRMQFYASLDDCLKPDRSPPIAGSMSVVAGLKEERSIGRLAGTIDGRAALFTLHGRLYDATRPISSCVAAQPTTEGDPLRAAGVLYRFPVTLAPEFTSRALLVISTSGRFVQDGQAVAVSSALEGWLGSLKDRRALPYFELIEITDAGNTRRVVDSDRLATMAVQGGDGSLREALDGLSFVGTARRALGDLRQVVENHGGGRIDRVLYIVDSTNEPFNSAEIGTVYDLVGRKGISFRVVSLANCEGWRSIVPGNQNLVCSELNQNAAATRDLLRHEFDRLVAMKQGN